MRSEIICVGSEILLGEITNTNARWLASRLSEENIPHYFQSVVGDNISRLSDAITAALSRSDLIFLTGGLGPTPDDLTHESLATALGLPLEQSDAAHQNLIARFKQLGRSPSESNFKQSMLPKGSVVLENPIGTACGCYVETEFMGETKRVFTFPGVPSEFKKMFDERAMSILSPLIDNSSKLVTREVWLWGIPESQVGELIRDDIDDNNPSIGIYASKTGIRIRLSSTAKDAIDLIDKKIDKLKKIFGDHIFSTNKNTLEHELISALSNNGETFVTAESCTGGGIGELITEVSGASSVFSGGFITYSNELKEKLLGVDGKKISRHGAVSSEVAIQMAEGAQRLTEADYAVSVTGVAGPTGGSDEKPVGTVWFGLSYKDARKSISFKMNFGQNPRATIRHRAKMTALFAILLSSRKSGLFEKLYLEKNS